VISPKIQRFLIFAGVAFAALLVTLVFRLKSLNDTEFVPVSATQQTGPLVELEPVLDRALVAYNAGNERAFLAEFASTAPGIRAEGAYRRLFDGIYKSEFGKFEGKRLDSKDSVPDRDWGALIYDAAFKKRAKSRLIANFIRENGVVKLMQIRFDHPDSVK
jgi:hypothetical protein